MLAQSKEVRDAWRASQRTLDIKVVVGGKTYTATDINSLKYDSGAYTGDTFAIGSTYSNSVQIEFSHLVENLKLGTEVLPSIGIKTSSGYVYEPLGVFIIASEIKMDRNNNLTTISASDRFCGLEGAYKSKLTYPAKVLDVIAEICAQSGVKANIDDLARLPHQEDLPVPITGQTYRKALGWLAQLYAGYTTFDRQGLFTIRTIAEPNYELDPSQYEQAGLTKNEAPYKISGIQCQVTTNVKTRDGEDTEETKTYQVGDANGAQIKLENNIMTAERLNAIWEQLKDITFYPFSLNWFGNPAVEAGDWLRLQDKQGNSFVVPNNSYTLDFNGGLSATSKADQSSSSDQGVSWQGNVTQTIKELQARKAPDGTVIFPPSVSEPPKNAKFNDVWFKKNGNATELWVFEKQDDGSGKWIRKDLSDGEIRKMVEQAQSSLNQAKADIVTNKQKADTDIENLNKSIEANKKIADDSLQKLSNSITKLQDQYDNSVVPDLTKVTNDVSDALQKYISAQNSIADLTKQAQQQGKNIDDVTKTVDGLNINYANLLGDVNSTKVDVKGMQTTLGNANGDIAQLKATAQNLQTLLAGKVDNSTYTNFVNLTNQALNAKLTASDLNGYAKTADLQATANGLKLNIDSVTDRMNNLKIGSRNLLHDTSDQYKTLVNDNAWLAQSTASDIYTSTANYHGGDWFTYAATINNNSDHPVSLETWLFKGQEKGHDPINVNSHSQVVPAHAQNQRVWTSFQITDETYWIRTYVIFSDGKGTAGEKIQVKDERLVFGTVSNTWSPNPEDTEHNLSELSARITATSQQFSSYYTKSETDSRTNSAKNDAVNTIKNDSNWHGLSNILTNSGFLQNADGFLQKVQQTTQPMIDTNNGGGINIFTGTKGYDDWHFSNHGAFDDVNELKDDRIKTKITHLYGAPGKDNGLIYNKSIAMQAGEYYTISFLARYYQQLDTPEKIVNYPIYLFSDYTDRFTGGSSVIQIHQVSNKWLQYSATFKIEHSGNYGGWRILSYTDEEFPGGSLYFANIKLERGRIATPWAPAPEDLATQISFSELSQSLEGLRSTVSGNYGQLQNTINQTNQATRNEITDKVAGLQNQITSTANSFDVKIANLQVGNRNLLHNTSDQYRTLTGSNWLAQSTASDIYTSTANYHNGNWFTYAATITNNSDHPVSLETWLFKGQEKGHDPININSHSQIVPAHAQNQKVWTSFQITAETWWIRTYVIFNDGVAPVNSQVQVKDERLVEGKYPSSWSPNPDDINQQFTNLSATISGLQSTVSNNYGQLQSLNTQTATAIRNEVTDKVNNLQGQITTQANNINLSIGSGGDLSNLCHNSTFDRGLEGWSSDKLYLEGPWPNLPTQKNGTLFVRDAYYGNFFPVSKGEKYFTSVFAENGSAHDFVLGLEIQLKDGSFIWNGGSFIPGGQCKQADGIVVIPDNAVQARIWVSIQTFSDFGWVRFTNVVVKKNDTLAQINMSAGTTLIQNDKIYMDASSTIFSGKAFIPSAAITSLNADKITTGTLNAANVNIINLNANNITTGTLTGSNGQFYLDSGSLHVWQSNHDAWIDQNGIHDYDNNGNNVWIKKGGISVYGNTSSIDMRDGEIHLNKKRWVTEDVLASDYGSITKADNVFRLGTSGLALTGTNGFLLKTNNWEDGTLDRMGGYQINGSGIAGNENGFMQLASGKQLFFYAGSPVSSGGFNYLPHLVLDGTIGNGKTELSGYFSSYDFTSLDNSWTGGLRIRDNSMMLYSLDGKNGLRADSDSVTIRTGDKFIAIGGMVSEINDDFSVVGNFTVTGKKNAIVPTSRGMAAINAYETAEYYFGDIGEAQTNSDGIITVMIDPFFLETVNTVVPYQVFLTSYGDANVWIASRSANCFVVKSSKPNIHFSWEIKAKRKGYENDRMEIVKGVNQNE